jgi:flagellar motility protein MotE (MotC chaperone)
MLRGAYGKILIVGLGVTLFAKAAVSVPLPPFRTETPPAPEILVQAAAKDEKAEAEPEETVPPLVEGLSQKPAQCETPEEVLAALAIEREVIEEQRLAVSARESELALAREKLQIEKAALLELQSAITDLLARVEAAKTDDLDRLIQFYKNMKPADAARIMDDMDIETTIMILGTMKPRTAAPILAKMSPVRARAVSKIILERSQLPGDQDLNGIRLN